RMQEQRSYRKINTKEFEAYRYLTHWYYVVIREMAALSEFRLDPHWIRSRLQYPVSVSEIAQALEFLKAHGFIEVLGDGRARLPEKEVNCLGGVYKIAMGQFNEQMFSLAAQAIKETPREQRNITFYTLALSAKRFELLRKIMDEALDRIAELDQSEDD